MPEEPPLPYDGPDYAMRQAATQLHIVRDLADPEDSVPWVTKGEPPEPTPFNLDMPIIPIGEHAFRDESRIAPSLDWKNPTRADVTAPLLSTHDDEELARDAFIVKEAVIMRDVERLDRAEDWRLTKKMLPDTFMEPNEDHEPVDHPSQYEFREMLVLNRHQDWQATQGTDPVPWTVAPPEEKVYTGVLVNTYV